jgi:hypothetical protein
VDDGPARSSGMGGGGGGSGLKGGGKGRFRTGVPATPGFFLSRTRERSTPASLAHAVYPFFFFFRRKWGTHPQDCAGEKAPKKKGKATAFNEAGDRN